MKRYFLSALFSLFCFVLFSQNLKFARECIDTLCSPDFAGREYYNSGIEKAATFIYGKFKESNLSVFSTDYNQEFFIPVNKIENAEISQPYLKPGIDFIVDKNSPSVQGRYRVMYLTKKSIQLVRKHPSRLKKFKQKALCVSDELMKKDKEINEFIHSIIATEEYRPAVILALKSPPLLWEAYKPEQKLHIPVLTVLEEKFLQLHPHFISITIKSDAERKFKVKNLSGYFKGTEFPDTFLVFCAHYDHLGSIGEKVYCPGANDNASGVAMILDLMKFYNDTVHRTKYSVAFITFAGEESGLLGSNYFVKHPLIPLKQIKFLINLDMVGTGKEGIQVVNGSVFSECFQKLNQINDSLSLLPQIKIRGEACNSDHCLFYQKGVPCFYIYSLDKDYPFYHVPEDRPERLPLTGYEGIFKLLIEFYKVIDTLPIPHQTE